MKVNPWIDKLTGQKKEFFMTEASLQALQGLRDLSTLQWYVIPMLAVTFFIYTQEIKKAGATGNWNTVLAGVTLFGADFVNENLNGWILNLTGRSALWTAPGPTALRTMVGWNIEIMFMFAILGIIYANTINDDKTVKILGIPNRWFYAVGYSVFCVFIETFLNKGNLLIWDYAFWDRTFAGIWLIIIFGYLWFFVAAKFVIELEDMKKKIITICVLYGTAILLFVVAKYLLGWVY